MNYNNYFAPQFNSFEARNFYDYRSQNKTFPANQSNESTSGNRIYASRNDNDARKIFVGGLSLETSEDDLRQYFQQFGEVVDVSLKRNPTTNLSRGFGFVLFADQAGVDRTVAHPSHILHGRTIDPKRALAEGSHELGCKVFVGGIDPGMSKEDIIATFSQYGKVEQLDLPFDKVKNERRSFGFITFESEEVADNVCRNYKVMCGNRKVDVKRVYTKDQKPIPDTASRVRPPVATFPPSRVPFPCPQRQGRGRGRVDPATYETNGMFRSGCQDYNDDFSVLQEAFNTIAAVASGLEGQLWEGRGYGRPWPRGGRAFHNSKRGGAAVQGSDPEPQNVVPGGRGRGRGVPGRGTPGRGMGNQGEAARGYHPYRR